MKKKQVRHDRIQVGDLIEYEYQQIQGENHLGYVTKVNHDTREITAFWSNDLRESPIYYTHDHEPIVGHWKVINFEEETKMDELKVYTGKETIELLLKGKVLKTGSTDYRLLGDELQVNFLKGKGWEASQVYFNNLLVHNFTEVTLPQVGDWVRVTTENGTTYTGKLTSVSSNGMKAKWNENIYVGYLKFEKTSYEILSPEQVSEYKREQAFVKVGRKLNEFKHGDIVYIDALAVVASVITKNNGMEEIKLHGINEAGKGYTARAHQLTPISFIEQQVDLS